MVSSVFVDYFSSHFFKCVSFLCVSCKLFSVCVCIYLFSYSVTVELLSVCFHESFLFPREKQGLKNAFFYYLWRSAAFFSAAFSLSLSFFSLV